MTIVHNKYSDSHIHEVQKQRINRFGRQINKHMDADKIVPQQTSKRYNWELSNG
jgi:hypothetical protein